jgi:predicted O-methyltransferase YrrM
MMDKTMVLDRLAQDKPLFHHLDDDGVQRVALAGITAPPGDTSWAVGPVVLRWIADHVSGEMVTAETGAGKTTVLFTALAKHHYCCTVSEREADKIRAYLERIGVPNDKLTFLVGTTDETLSRFGSETLIDFAYIDGCHGYPFPALDWHYIDKHLNVGGIIGMDDAQLRPVREHCEFLEENGTYQLAGVVSFARFYRKLTDQKREWIDQAYSRAKKDTGDWRLMTRIRRKASKWLKPYLY